MNDKADAERSLDEGWSGLMDGQSTELEIRRMLRDADDADLQRWHRYQLVQSALRNELAAGGVVDLRAGVAAALDGACEQPEQQATSSGMSRAWRALGSAAIAASVAAVVVVGGLGLREGQLPGTDAELAASEAEPETVPAQPLLASGSEPEIIRLAPAEAGASERSLPDLQRHADMMVLVGAGGMSPYARVSTLKPVLVREQR